MGSSTAGLAAAGRTLAFGLFRQFQPFFFGSGELFLTLGQCLGGFSKLDRLAREQLGIRQQPLQLADLGLKPFDFGLAAPPTGAPR